MKVRAVYTPTVFDAAPGEDLAVVASRMEFDAVGALVVRDGREMVGIITERDILRAVAEERNLEGTIVEEYMTADPLGVDLHAELSEAVATMCVLGARHLPVLDRGEIVGMISARDVIGVEAFSELAGAIGR